MDESTAVVVAEDRKRTFSEEEKNIIKSQLMPNASDPELKVFLAQCQRTGLDPMIRQIYPMPRRKFDRESNQWTETYQPQISIDGARLVAERTGHYEGQLGPLWCGEDGDWKDVWLLGVPPKAAKVGVLKKGFKEPLWAVATWSSYVQTDKGGQATKMWQKMADLMLAKCAEMLALRKAFPHDLSGLYSAEEMSQSETEKTEKLEAKIVQDIARAKGNDPRVSTRNISRDDYESFVVFTKDSLGYSGTDISEAMQKLTGKISGRELTPEELEKLRQHFLTKKKSRELGNEEEKTEASLAATIAADVARAKAIDARVPGGSHRESPGSDQRPSGQGVQNHAEPKNQTQGTSEQGLISEKQIARLFAIANAHSWKKEDIDAEIKHRYQIDSIKDMRWLHYDEFVKHVQANTIHKDESDFAPDEKFPFENKD